MDMHGAGRAPREGVDDGEAHLVFRIKHGVGDHRQHEAPRRLVPHAVRRVAELEESVEALR